MSFQKTIIAGYVGGDVAAIQTSDSKVANFSVAVNESFGDTTKTTWFQIAAWNALADMVTAHITKGQLVLVDGRISANTWVDVEGNLQFALRLTAQTIRLLGGKPSSEADTDA